MNKTKGIVLKIRYGTGVKRSYYISVTGIDLSSPENSEIIFRHTDIFLESWVNATYQEKTERYNEAVLYLNTMFDLTLPKRASANSEYVWIKKLSFRNIRQAEEFVEVLAKSINQKTELNLKKEIAILLEVA